MPLSISMRRSSQSFTSSWKSSSPHLQFLVDSMTAIAYVTNQDGTWSLLLDLATSILDFAQSRQVRILLVFVPSADVVSRFLTLPDWHLRQSAFDSIVDRWGSPEIDLFAMQALAHLP